MTDFETKDSGKRAEYDSGMQRDTQDGKPRFALMWTELQPYEQQMVTRYAALLGRGAKKYEDRNWEKGDSKEELERAKDSLLRHAAQLVAGETDEDHAAAVWFNTQAIEYFRWRIAEKAKKSDLSFDFKFEPGLDGSRILEILTGERTGMFIRGDFVKPDVLGFDGSKSSDEIVVGRRLQSGDMEIVPDADLKRPDDWLKKYGINLVAGDLGDTYTEIDYNEFRDRLNKCQWQHDTRFPRPPKRVGDINEFGDTYCPNDLEAVNKKCWKCGWVRPLDQGEQGK